MQAEVKEIIFDYFNLIPKEYELAYEKWRNDEVYKEAIEQTKSEIDREYVDSKYDVLPEGLTRAVAENFVRRKQEVVNQIIMAMMGQQRGESPDGRIMLKEKDLVFSLAKFDDELFIQSGFRKEQIDKAITVYGLDKEQPEATP